MRRILALVLPALGLALPVHNNPTTFVTLDVPINEGDTAVLTLRLDIGETELPCGRADVTVDGQALAQDDHGNGQGGIRTRNGHDLSSAWSFTCRETARDDARMMMMMMMKMQIHQWDGVEIAPFNFSAVFTQTAPLYVWDVDGAAVVRRIHRPIAAHDAEDVSLDRLHSQIHDVHVLHVQTQKLHAFILRKEDTIAELLGRRKPSVQLAACGALNCLPAGADVRVKDPAAWAGCDVEQLKKCVAQLEGSSSSTEFPDTFDSPKRADDFPGKARDEAPRTYVREDRGKGFLGTQVPLSVAPVAGDHDDLDHPRIIERKRPPLATIIGVAAFSTVCVMTTGLLAFLCRHSNRPHSEECEKADLSGHLAHGQAQNSHYGGSRLDRKGLLRAERLPCGNSSQTSLARSVMPTVNNLQLQPRLRSDSEPSNTLEEELASFMRAVDVVDSLVATEEGRMRASITSEDRCRGFIAMANDGHGASYNEDESPPPYESEGS